MISIIETILHKHIGVAPDQFMYIASDILDEVQKNGMNPPLIENPNWPGEEYSPQFISRWED